MARRRLVCAALAQTLSVVACSGEDRPALIGEPAAETGGTGGADGLPPVQRPARAVAIAAGEETTCAVTEAGELRCWGSNSVSFENLGHPQLAFREAPYPVPVRPLDGPIVALTASSRFACAAGASGPLACWGSYWFDEGLDMGPTYRRWLPQEIPGFADVVALSNGTEEVCAVDSAGDLRCYSGTGSSNGSAEVVTDFGAPVRRIAVGAGNRCALLEGGRLACIGSNQSGQLGNGSTEPSTTPVTPEGFESDVIDVSMDDANTCAVKADGAVYCWGENAWGEVDVLRLPQLFPTLVEGIGPALRVDVGYRKTCAVLQSGRVALWGDSATEPDDFIPVPPALLTGLADIADVACGNNHVCALTTSGSVWCEGNNRYGQLGNNYATGTSIYPVPVVSLQ